jgi:hypothetical protein
MMKAHYFCLFTALAGIVLLTGILLAVPPAGTRAQTLPPPTSIHLPLIFSQTGSSVPTLLAVDQPHPVSLAVDSDNVYWTNCGFSLGDSPDGSILAYSKSQGTTITLLSDRHCPDHLYVQPEALYWLEHTWTDGTGEFSLYRWSMTGGEPLELVTYRANTGSLSLDDTYVYWLENPGTVMRLPKTGLGTPQPAPVPALVFDGQFAYWLNGAGELIRSGKDGSSPVTLVTRDDLDALAGRQPSNVAILQIFANYSDLYITVFVDNYPGMLSCTDQGTELMRMPKSGGAFEYLFSAPRRLSAWIIEPFAYFSAECYHGPLEVDLESLAVRPSVTWSELPVAMADDAANVYWVDYDNGWVKRMAK